MSRQTMKCAVVMVLAGAVGLGVTTTSRAAPVPSSTAAVKAVAPSAASEVRYNHYRGYRGRYYRNGGGVALGVLGLAGAAAGAAAYGPGYSYDPGYSYGPGYYGNPGYYGRGYDRRPREGINYYGFDRPPPY